jgi:hypothetical protein
MLRMVSAISVLAFLRMENGIAVYELASGSYVFVVKNEGLADY